MRIIQLQLQRIKRINNRFPIYKNKVSVITFQQINIWHYQIRRFPFPFRQYLIIIEDINNLSMFSFIIYSILATLSLNFYLPLSPNTARCMIVYTVGEFQTLKTQMLFPQLPSQLQDEFYLVKLVNQDDDSFKVDKVVSGSYKKQHQLQHNVIYELCVELRTQRNITQVMIYYVAETVYDTDVTEVVVPQTLLRKYDFIEIYKQANKISDTIVSYTDMQKQRGILSVKSFQETKTIDKRLITISLIEVIVIIGAGVYQFCSLIRFMRNKMIL